MTWYCHRSACLSPRPPAPKTSEIDVGAVKTEPPSFLERWGVVFLGWVGGRILLTGTALVAYFLAHQPPPPNLGGLNNDQIKGALETHKLLLDQWHESLSNIFDLLITKTAVPIATLLLGYLFGRSKGAGA